MSAVHELHALSMELLAALEESLGRSASFPSGLIDS